ncbi:MAG: hypothetical protein ACFFEV_01825 [Candidatus Thorarchaeota archaeon]
MSVGGPPPSFIMIFASAACIILGPMITMVLGIPESIPIVLGVAIMVVGAPIILRTEKDRFGAMPPCFLFGFTGFFIIFAGIWLSWPHGNWLSSVLVIVGILHAVLGSALGTMYIRKMRTKPARPLWSGRSQFRRDMTVYEDKPEKEHIIEREVLLRQRIPLECDNCGAPLSAEDIDWVGPDTVKCPNCGHSLRVETERI